MKKVDDEVLKLLVKAYKLGGNLSSSLEYVQRFSSIPKKWPVQYAFNINLVAEERLHRIEIEKYLNTQGLYRNSNGKWKRKKVKN
jgi:hypothetical protein